MFGTKSKTISENHDSMQVAKRTAELLAEYEQTSIPECLTCEKFDVDLRNGLFRADNNSESIFVK